MPLSFASGALTPSLQSFRTLEVFTSPIDAGTTAQYSVTVQTSAGGTIANTDLVSVTLTVIDEETHRVVNSRQNQDVLGGSKTGANNVTVSATADLVWTIQALDSVVIDETRTKKIEFHRAIFRFTTATDVSIHEVRFVIRPAFQLLPLS